MEKPTILAVDDEPGILRLLRLQLKAEYTVLTAENGTQALQAFSSRKPDLVLLDVILPDMSGLDVLTEMKSRGAVPVILMTAASSEEVRMEALNRGADEFISKPFVTEHLLASIQYLLSAGEGDSAPGTRVIAGDLEIDLAQRTVHRGGQRIALTRSEWTLIEELTRQRGQPQLHQEILSRVWGSEYQNDNEYLALWVRRLRAKLGDDDAAPRIIVPYLDVGYRLNVRPSLEDSDGS